MTALLALALAAALQAGPAFRSLEKGDQSNMDDARQAVARTAGEWNALWRLHAPDRTPPAVDFAREMVAAVFIGSRPTAGFAVDIITIIGAKSEGGALVVQYRETRPAPGLVAAQVLTSAYHIVALPASPGAVRFERVP